MSNGGFTVTLDFGAAAFPGAPRFLQIEVRPSASVDAFTPLTPRYPITSTPYAIRSAQAGTADKLSVSCVNRVTSSQIGSLPTGSGNYVQNTTTQQAASGERHLVPAAQRGRLGIDTATRAAVRGAGLSQKCALSKAALA